MRPLFCNLAVLRVKGGTGVSGCASSAGAEAYLEHDDEVRVGDGLEPIYGDWFSTGSSGQHSVTTDLCAIKTLVRARESSVELMFRITSASVVESSAEVCVRGIVSATNDSSMRERAAYSLVKEQDFGVLQQQPRDREALLLPTADHCKQKSISEILLDDQEGITTH